MKYFKFTQIDAETGISWAIKQPLSGPSWPSIPGLTNWISLSHNPIYHVAIVDDAAQADPDNHFFELTAEEYATELRDHIQFLLDQEKNSIYQQENEFRNSIFQKYHDTATIAGIYKYDQAKELVADNSAAAPDVRAEAAARGLTPLVMANRIIQNHEDFRSKEAKIAGIRGKILDRIDSFVFDLNDPAASVAEYYTQEVIGSRTVQRIVNDQLQDVSEDVTVPKYSLVLPLRYSYE